MSLMNTLKAALGGAAALAISFAAQADELKLAHFSSIQYHLHVEMFVPLAEKLAEATGGETTIRIYPGGELGAGPAKQYDRAIDGVADIVYALPDTRLLNSRKRCWPNSPESSSRGRTRPRRSGTTSRCSTKSSSEPSFLVCGHRAMPFFSWQKSGSRSCPISKA